MSVEIEVGLENAARVKNLPNEELPLEEPPKGFANPKIRRGLLIGGVVLVAILVGLFLYYHNRESTDDAQVDGHITPVSSKIYGRVAEVLVNDNEQVKAGQVLVRIDPRDYKAALDEAEADAKSAGVDVPRTRENVASGTSSADAQLLGAQAELARAQVTYDQAKTS